MSFTRVLAAVAFVALVAAPASFGHAGAPGYTSTITGIQPAVAGIDISVLEGDDRLRVRYDGGGVLVVEGYDGEPYLRFSREGTFRNERSPATYLNDDRYGQAAIPAAADPEAEPEWVQVSNAPLYEWHDHRIHWMTPNGSPVVRSAPGESHHVFDWSVPGTIDGRPFAVKGSLDYSPADSFPWLAAGSLAGAVAIALGAVAWGVRRRRRST
jgi:hypothetical protein